jgi:hypothetical protein
MSKLKPTTRTCDLGCVELVKDILLKDYCGEVMILLEYQFRREAGVMSLMMCVMLDVM